MAAPPETLLGLYKELVKTLQQYVAALKTPSNSHLNAPGAKQTPTTSPTASRALLDKMCLAIADFEGGPGDLNYRNRNPGNLRKWPGRPIRNGFAVFDTWEQGMSALRQLITLAAMGKSQSYHPNMTLLQFFEKYAPSSDGNHPFTYASFVAKRMGVPISFQIKSLL